MFANAYNAHEQNKSGREKPVSYRGLNFHIVVTELILILKIDDQFKQCREKGSIDVRIRLTTEFPNVSHRFDWFR